MVGLEIGLGVVGLLVDFVLGMGVGFVIFFGVVFVRLSSSVRQLSGVVGGGITGVWQWSPVNPVFVQSQ